MKIDRGSGLLIDFARLVFDFTSPCFLPETFKELTIEETIVLQRGVRIGAGLDSEVAATEFFSLIFVGGRQARFFTMNRAEKAF